MSFTDFLFDFDKSEVRSAETGKVTKLVDYMKDNPNIMIGIDGHADPRGSDAYNQPLSQRRADAIKASLVDRRHPDEQDPDGRVRQDAVEVRRVDRVLLAA